MSFSENSAEHASSASAEAVAAGSTWEPRFPFDHEKPNTKKFDDLVDAYDAYNAVHQPEGPVPLSDGWHVITPVMAEELLRRNPPGANRKASLATIQYYAMQMKSGAWPKTGQPLIFSENGMLIDGQHRLWGCLFSGVPFTTYVVTGVPEYPELFAYIDNCRPRSPAAALQTAGFNGVSTLISQIIKIKNEIGGYTPSAKTKMPRLTPVEMVQLAKGLPNAQQAAHLASGDWDDAVTAVGYKDVVAYLGMDILDNYDQAIADDFFDAVGAPVDADTPEPISKFRKLMHDDMRKDKRMKRHQVLGNLIKVFNAWLQDEELPKRWTMSVDEDFPSLLVLETDDSVATPDAV
jgi:hypothetical protein